MKLAFALALLLEVVSGAADAAAFQNGSFESGSVSNTCNVYNLGVGDTTITGWTVSVGNIDWEGPTPCGWQASNGSNSIDLVGDFFGVGGIQQTFDTIPGQAYQISFDLAGNYGGAPTIKPLAVTVNGVTTNFTFDTTGKSQFNMGWTRHTVNFVASGATSTLSFVSDTTGSGGVNAGAVIDNVQVAPVSNAVVAVPLDWAAWAAALLLVLAFVVLRRRRMI